MKYTIAMRLLAAAAATIGAGAATAAQPGPPRREVAEWQFQSHVQQVLAQVHLHPNFGGFIFRSVPEPHAIVMFTGDAEAHLRRYTSDPRIRAQRVDLTLAELERLKDDMASQLHHLGLRCFSVDGDEERNRVAVTTPELDTVRAAIAAKRLRLPPKFAFLPGACAQLRSQNAAMGVADSPPPVVSVPSRPPTPVLVPAPSSTAPPLPARRVVRAPQPRAALQQLISAADFPASALADGEQGRVRVALDIGADGRVHGCTVTRSSGSAALDSTSCRLVRSRGRFTPATDSSGSPVPGRYEQELDWALPQQRSIP